MKQLFTALLVSVVAVLVIAQSKFPNKIIAPAAAITNMVGTGDHVGVAPDGTLQRTNIAGGSGITSINENTASSQFITLGTNRMDGIGPTLSNGVNGVNFNFPWAGHVVNGVLHSNDFQRIYGTNFPHANFTNGISVGTDSGAVGQIALFDAGGTEVRIEAPSDIDNAGEVLRWFSTTNAGVWVKVNVEGVTNRLTNVTLRAGLVLSHNGTDYVATNAIIGATNGGNAAAGYIGEYVVATNMAGSVGTTGEFYDLTSISLTPGDWDITALISWQPNGATFSSTLFITGISTTSGNSATGLIPSVNYLAMANVVPTTFAEYSLLCPNYRFSTPVSATVYLKGYVSAYTVAVPSNWGRISARRVR